MHRCAPEIIEEDIFQGRVRPQVFVVADCADVIKNKTAVTAIVIAQNSCQNYGGPQGGPTVTFNHITHFYKQIKEKGLFGDIFRK